MKEDKDFTIMMAFFAFFFAIVVIGLISQVMSEYFQQKCAKEIYQINPNVTAADVSNVCKSK